MALKYAVASGNWSNTATWNGGTLPGAGDDVHANGLTVTIDQDVTVISISNKANAPAVAGGTFVISSNRTILANIYAGTVSGVACVQSSAAVVVSITGEIKGGTGSTTVGVSFTNGGSILYIIGNSYGGESSQQSHGVSSTGTVNFIGNAYGSSTGFINNAALVASYLFITGNVYGGSGVSGCYGVICNNSCIVNGNVYGGSNSINNVGIQVLGGTCIVNGILIGGATLTPALQNNNTSVVSIDVAFFGVNGSSPFVGCVRFKDSGSYLKALSVAGDEVIIVDETTIDFPLIENVRNGVNYLSGLKTGTLIVPSPSNVRKGVPTDDTIGTAEVTGEDIIEALNLSTNPLAERLRNVATVQTTGDQIAALNTEE